MSNSLAVAIGGFGAIGMAVARKLDEGVEGLHLAALSAFDREAAAGRMADFHTPVPVLAASDLATVADVVVECAPAEVFTEIAEPALKAGRIFMPLSVGQLLMHPEYEELARRHGGRIIAPSGALLGLDAVRAAAEGNIESVTMVTRKPPQGLAGAPYLEEQGISLDGLNAPLKIFDGSAREGARGFPANVNVAAALSLAGVGPDRTRLEIWADPTVTRNTHTIRVEADSVRFEMKIENVPSEENPRTGKLTPLSVIAALRGLTSPMRIGT
jgi:aspartate dehydrogenase